MHSYVANIICYTIPIWRFSYNRGTPSHHPFVWHFPLLTFINQPFWGNPPSCGTPHIIPISSHRIAPDSSPSLAKRCKVSALAGLHTAGRRLELCAPSNPGVMRYKVRPPNGHYMVNDNYVV